MEPIIKGTYTSNTMAGRKLVLQELKEVPQTISFSRTDVLTERNNVSGRLNVTSSGSLPGGEVEKFVYFYHNPKSNPSL
jgi:hypothetical protein